VREPGKGLGRKFEEEKPFDSAKSPFIPLNDEEIFITRQNDEKSKKSMRMSSATARIYEKTTATTRAPLSRVRDLDISPKRQEMMSDHVFGNKHRTIISAAMQLVKNRK